MQVAVLSTVCFINLKIFEKIYSALPWQKFRSIVHCWVTYGIFSNMKRLEFFHEMTTTIFFCVADQRDFAVNDIDENMASCKVPDIFVRKQPNLYFLGIFE